MKKYASVGDMRELDRLAIEEYGVGVPIMMEYAGYFPAIEAVQMFGKGSKIAVLVGKGNNGGDGLCCARHLANFGCRVRVFLVSRDLKDSPANQLNILQKMSIPIAEEVERLSNYDGIVDALLGYNAKGNPRGKTAEFITAANESGKKILAIDFPSGMDPGTGKPNKPCIKATATVALSVVKKGLTKENASPYVGKIVASYMTIPREAYRKLGLEYPFNSDF